MCMCMWCTRSLLPAPLHLPPPYPDPARFEEATYRTTRWLDRCMAANRNPGKQNLFPIVQGGFDVQLREVSMQQVRRQQHAHTHTHTKACACLCNCLCGMC